MKVRVLRGVCIGVDRHLKVDDTADLEPALVTFLAGIGAVEKIADEPPPQPEPPAAEPAKEPPPVEPQPEPPAESPAEPVPVSTPAKAGKKEK